jgi:imidazoleglycerol-phosphate dehydratase
MRQATIDRRTKETDVHLQLTLDGQGQHELATGVPFFDHMLSHVAVHGGLDLVVKARGDTQVDDHHTVEDIGICFGQALRQALGDKRGITRYGHQITPMDESLVLMAIDVSGRPVLVYDVTFPEPTIGTFHAELVREFLQAVTSQAGIALHVTLLHGQNAHHIAEAVFKGLGRCLGEAAKVRPDRADQVPSTKGMLE